VLVEVGRGESNGGGVVRIVYYSVATISGKEGKREWYRVFGFLLFFGEIRGIARRKILGKSWRCGYGDTIHLLRGKVNTEF